MTKIMQPIRFELNSNYLLSNKQQLSKYNYWPTLVIDRTHLLPFQIDRLDEGEHTQELANTKINIISVKLYERNAPVTKYTELVTYLTFNRYYTTVDTGYIHSNVYLGNSIIPAIPQGYYYLVITDDSSNTWTSSEFKSCFSQYTVTFEYSHPKPFNYFVQPITYKVIVESKSYDIGEYLETTEKYPDDILNDTVNFYKMDKLYAVTFLADQYTYDAIQFMQMFDTVYLTDETGIKNLIKISSIEKEPIAQSNHVSLTVKYYIIENQLLNINTNTFQYLDQQVGVDYSVPTPKSGVHIGGKDFLIGGKKLKVKK